MRFILLFLLSFSVFAEVPVDVVFDIDLTIVTLINEGDPLADPAHPRKGTIAVQYTEDGSLRKDRYRVFEGVKELLEKLRQDPRVRLSFFSGGSDGRNLALTKALKLSDGTSFFDLAQGRVYGRSVMTPTDAPPTARIRDRFKKDLHTVNPDISDVIIVDDIKEFVPDSQRSHVLWIGENFPFPDRRTPTGPITEEVFQREKNKYQWISSQLDRALAERFQTGRPLSAIVDELTDHQRLTPFNSELLGPRCRPGEVLLRLLAE